MKDASNNPRNPFSRNMDGLPQTSIPSWIIEAVRAGPDAVLPLESILTDSLYYPACGLNGTPIKHFSGFIHSFVYADYGIGPNQYLSNIHMRNGIRGYLPVVQKRLKREDVVPMGWTPQILPQRRDWGRLRMRERRASPFGHWSIWERTSAFGDDHGPKYFSLLYFCGEMSAVYQGLYIRLGIAPKVIALIQPGVMGGEWENPVADDSFFKQVVNSHPAGLPQYLLRGSYNHGGNTLSKWPEFQNTFRTIHERSATLWARCA